ncbi:DExH-box ATP-dependent RNA helicase DExH5, mitochondrial isoform X1, partial [Tanacetum coccineum]
FKVLEKVGSVAYKLELSQELSRVHNTFHVSYLKKCYANEPLAVLLDGLHFDEMLQFVEELVEIIDREVKRLNRSCIPIIKVRWNSRRGLEFTWEREDQFRKRYPHLFTKTTSSSNINALRGATCSIICTQPHRISAMSVSERIATERGERLGETERLLVDRNLKGVTHVIIDEIHERGMNEDFLLIVLKELFPRRPDLRLVLMSATLDADLFSSYFGGVPLVQIPLLHILYGFTHPMRTYFLKDVLEQTGYRLTAKNQIDDYGQDRAWKSNKQFIKKRKSQIASAVEEALGSADFKNYNVLEQTGYNLTAKNQIDDYGQDRAWKSNKQFIKKRKSQIASAVEEALGSADFKNYSQQTRESMFYWNPDCMSFNLIEFLLCKICENEKLGSVLWMILHIIEAYKHIAVAGGSQLQFSLLSYLGVEFPLELDPWSHLHTHILSDYTSHEVETLRDSFPLNNKSLTRLLSEVPSLRKLVLILLEILCVPENSEKDAELHSGERVHQVSDDHLMDKAHTDGSNAEVSKDNEMGKPLTESVSAIVKDSSSEAGQASTSDNNSSTSIIDAQRCMSLYFTICTKKHSLFRQLLIVYNNMSIAAKQMLNLLD